MPFVDSDEDAIYFLLDPVQTSEATSEFGGDTTQTHTRRHTLTHTDPRHTHTDPHRPQPATNYSKPLTLHKKRKM